MKYLHEIYTDNSQSAAMAAKMLGGSVQSYHSKHDTEHFVVNVVSRNSHSRILNRLHSKNLDFSEVVTNEFN